jgi:hypothetical protein
MSPAAAGIRQATYKAGGMTLPSGSSPAGPLEALGMIVRHLGYEPGPELTIEPEGLGRAVGRLVQRAIPAPAPKRKRDDEVAQAPGGKKDRKFARAHDGDDATAPPRRRYEQSYSEPEAYVAFQRKLWAHPAFPHAKDVRQHRVDFIAFIQSEAAADETRQVEVDLMLNILESAADFSVMGQRAHNAVAAFLDDKAFDTLEACVSHAAELFERYLAGFVDDKGTRRASARPPGGQGTRPVAAFGVAPVVPPRSEAEPGPAPSAAIWR